MNRYNIIVLKFIFITALSFITNVVFAVDGNTLDTFYKNEVNSLIDKDDSYSGGSYRIKVFDGFVRIPKRYVLIGWNDRRIQFNSILPVGHPLEFSVSGILVVGEYRDIEQINPDNYKVLKEEDMNDLSVKILLDKKRNLKYVYIYNMKEYISILDENEKLWEGVVKSYEKYPYQ